MRRWLLLLVLAACAAPASAQPPRIAIIIDDVGYRLQEDRRLLDLPVEVALSVLPFSPHGSRIAAAASEQHRPLMLHLPMQSMAQQHLPAGSGLGLDTTQAALRATLAASLAAVPQARGVNNHQGSLLTRHPGHMRWLMQALACHRNLFFIDSYTTHHSVALDEARREQIPSARRDVFLDDDASRDAIVAQFERLIAIANRRGQALAIGHPLPETLAVLEEQLATLPSRGVILVSPERLLSTAPPPGAATAD